MILVTKSMYIISMHSTNFVIEQGTITQIYSIENILNIKSFSDKTPCSVNSHRQFRGAYSLLHLQVNTHTICARSDCLHNLLHNISSPFTIQHSIISHKTWISNNTTTRITNITTEVSYINFHVLSAGTDQIQVFWVWHCAVLQVDTDFSDMMPNPSTLKMEAIRSFKISVFTHSTAWSQNQKTQLRNYHVPSVYVKYFNSTDSTTEMCWHYYNEAPESHPLLQHIQPMHIPDLRRLVEYMRHAF